MKSGAFGSAFRFFGLHAVPSSLPVHHALLVYVWVPVGLGLLFGWIGTGRTGTWPLALSISFWVLCSWSNWLLCDCTSRASAWILRRQGAGLWLVLLTGAIAAQLLVYPVNYALVGFFQNSLLPDVVSRPSVPATLVSLIKSSVPGVALWIGINLALHRFMGLSRYGYPLESPPPAEIERVEAPAPSFFGRIPAHLGTSVQALAAEEHYMRVYTDRGSALMLYRTSDAIRELAGRDGCQVHRSYWVAREAVAEVVRTGGQVSLRLHDGLLVPVSRSFRVAAMAAGLLRSPALGVSAAGPGPRVIRRSGSSTSRDPGREMKGAGD